LGGENNHESGGIGKCGTYPETASSAVGAGTPFVGLFPRHPPDHQRTVFRYVKRTQSKWDDLLMDNKVFSNLAHIVPVIMVRVIAPILFRDFEKVLPVVIKLTDIYLIIVILLAINALLRILELVLKKSKAFADKPVSSYFQLIKIILYIAAGILIISILINKSPVYLLSALGAMTALGMLVFKDTILGFVASVQISANDMVRIGDWVEMPKFNADGDVIAINLNTVKVQNWDKTITTIPRIISLRTASRTGAA